MRCVLVFGEVELKKERAKEVRKHRKELTKA